MGVELPPGPSRTLTTVLSKSASHSGKTGVFLSLISELSELALKQNCSELSERHLGPPEQVPIAT